MDTMIAYCGINCTACDAYLATQANDRAAQGALLEKWRVEYDAPEMTLAAVTCDGCTSTGRLGGYCNECPMHACGAEKDVQNCASCDDYEDCATLPG